MNEAMIYCSVAISEKANIPVYVELSSSNISGSAKRARFVVSHKAGKIEIIGFHEDNVYLKYHRAAAPQDSSSELVFKSSPDGFWLDYYEEAESLLI